MGMPLPDEPVFDLAALRAEIDALDGELLTLIRRRLALAGSIAAAKREAGDTGFGFRPARELAIYRRVLAGIEDTIEAEAVTAVWRTLMAANLRRQGPLTVVAAEGNPALLARLHYGADALIRIVPEDEVVASASGQSHAVAVVPWPEDRAGEPWWTQLDGNGLRVVAALPMAGEGMPSALLLAHLEPEQAGFDTTFVVGRFVGSPAAVLSEEPEEDVRLVANTETHGLLAIDGFRAADASLTAPGVVPGSIVRIGSFARLS